MDELEDGPRLKILVVVDGFARARRTIQSASDLTAAADVQDLAGLEKLRGVRSVCAWVRTPCRSSSHGPSGTGSDGSGAILFVEAGSPRHSAYIERFNGKLGDDLTELEIFAPFEVARRLVGRFREIYNDHRP